jgi:hypothetical protein
MVVPEGFGALNFHLAQQEHWEQADAVRDGRQPKVDPDGALLEAFDTGLRVYRSREVHRTIAGGRTLVSEWPIKRLDPTGLWENDLFVLSYQHHDGPLSALLEELGHPGALTSGSLVAA